VASWAYWLSERAVSAWAAPAGASTSRYVQQTAAGFFKLGEVGARAPGAAVGCGGCVFAVLFISSVDVMQNCEGGLSKDTFLF
jgi:hypothetical protein